MKSLSARLRAPDENIQVLETDVLIIGGGVAGCLAAGGVFGPLGRDRVDLAGLERDPFAVVVQGIWEGLQALGAG